MKTPEDPLDRLLQADNAYVEDGGFTARVVSSLSSRQRSWLRPAILLGVTLIGFASLVWWLPSWGQIFVPVKDGGFIIRLSAQSLLTLGAMLVAGGSLLWSLFAALRGED